MINKATYFKKRIQEAHLVWLIMVHQYFIRETEEWSVSNAQSLMELTVRQKVRINVWISLIKRSKLIRISWIKNLFKLLQQDWILINNHRESAVSTQLVSILAWVEINLNWRDWRLQKANCRIIKSKTCNCWEVWDIKLHPSIKSRCRF